MGNALAIPDDNFATSHNSGRPPFHGATGVGRVAGCIVHRFVAQQHLAIRVPDRDVGISTNRKRTFPVVQIVDCRCGRAQLR